MNTRASARNATALVAVDMNAVTGVPAPSYTSGVHQCSGAALTLNARPPSTIAAPVSSSTPRLPSKPPIAAKVSDPVAPYTSALPYSSTALDMPPTIRYLRPASSDATRSASRAHSTYSAIENSSSPMNSVTNPAAPAIRPMPQTAASSSAWNSPWRPSSARPRTASTTATRPHADAMIRATLVTSSECSWPPNAP